MGAGMTLSQEIDAVFARCPDVLHGVTDISYITKSKKENDR